MIIDEEKQIKDLTDANNEIKAVRSAYTPSDKERETRSLILKHFSLGYVNMFKPRREFNDMSVIQRMMFDQMSFNTYQPNNGDALEGDEINSWKSRATKPIVRNKCISIAAHATARLIFPKVFAYDEQSQEQADAATVMRDLMEWACDKSDYEMTSLYAVIAALVNPAAIIYKEYGEVYREVKREKVNGKYKIEKILDEDYSGFKDIVVPVDEFYIPDFYEHDVQKQSWIIWRRVLPFTQLELKYKNKYDNFKYVRPGVQVVYNDANQSFYEVYDTQMRGEMGEEVIYWNKGLDLKLVMVNGVLLTDYDNPNPRNDKQYPFIKFGYELIDEGKCFYYKSLAFKLMQDANIVNTLYPMIIDGTYLSLMPPMVANGAETISADVIVPGAVTTFQNADSDLRPLNVATNLTQGMNTLFKVEESIDKSSEEPLLAGQAQGGTQTAYEISKMEQNAATVLGLFIKMISNYVRQYGKLLIGDIIQYMTIADVTDITDNAELVYKSFLLPGKQSRGKIKTRKITFDNKLPSEPQGPEEQLKNSYKVLEEEGGTESKSEIYKVNPELFRKLKYQLMITADTLNPVSEDLERAYNLEEYDRAIQNPMLDQEQITRDFLLSSYPKSREDVEKYFKKPSLDTQNPTDVMNKMEQSQQGQVAPTQPTAPAPTASSSKQINQLAQLLNK